MNPNEAGNPELSPPPSPVLDLLMAAQIDQVKVQDLGLPKHSEGATNSENATTTKNAAPPKDAERQTDLNLFPEALASNRTIQRVHSERPIIGPFQDNFKLEKWPKKHTSPPTATLMHHGLVTSASIANGSYSILPRINMAEACVSMPFTPGKPLAIHLSGLASVSVIHSIERKAKTAEEKNAEWRKPFKFKSRLRSQRQRPGASDEALEARPKQLFRTSLKTTKEIFKVQETEDPSSIYSNHYAEVTRFESPSIIVPREDLKQAVPRRAGAKSHVESFRVVLLSDTAQKLADNTVLFIPYEDDSLRSCFMKGPYLDRTITYVGGLLDRKRMHIKSGRWFWVTKNGRADVEKSMLANISRFLAATDCSEFEKDTTEIEFQTKIRDMQQETAHTENLDDGTLFSETLKSHGRVAAQNYPHSHLASRLHRDGCRNSDFAECPMFCSPWNTLLSDLMSASQPLPDDDKIQWDEATPLDNDAVGRLFMRNIFVGLRSQANVFRAITLMEEGYGEQVRELEIQSKSNASSSPSYIPKSVRKVFKRKTSNSSQKERAVSVPVKLTRRMFISTFIKEHDDPGNLTTAEKHDHIRKIAEADGFDLSKPLKDIPLACASADVVNYKTDVVTCVNAFDTAAVKTEKVHKKMTASWFKGLYDDEKESWRDEDPKPEVKDDKTLIVEDELSPLIRAKVAPAYSGGNSLPQAPISRPSSTYDQDTTTEDFSPEELASQQTHEAMLCAKTKLQPAGRPSSVLGVYTELEALEKNAELEQAELAKRATSKGRTSFILSFLPRSMQKKKSPSRPKKNKRSKVNQNPQTTGGIASHFKKSSSSSKNSKLLPERAPAPSQTTESSVGSTVPASVSSPVAAPPPGLPAAQTATGEDPSIVSEPHDTPPLEVTGSPLTRTSGIGAGDLDVDNAESTQTLSRPFFGATSNIVSIQSLVTIDTAATTPPASLRRSTSSSLSRLARNFSRSRPEWVLRLFSSRSSKSRKIKKVKSAPGAVGGVVSAAA